MKFHNPSTDEVVVTDAMSGLGTFILGPLNLLLSKLWLATVLWIVTTVILYVLSSSPILSGLVSNIVFAFLTPMFIRARYKAAGWVAVSDADPIESKYRECPRCKEQILAAATKCKHCGSDIEPLNSLS